MPKDTKTLGNNKARACESLGFVHKKRLCQRFDTTSYQNEEVVILNYCDGTGDDGTEVEIYLNNGKVLVFSMFDLASKLNRFRPITNTVVVLANERLNKVSTVNPTILQDLRNLVLQQIKDVKEDPSKVSQAKQVFQGVNTVINLAKTELEYRKYLDTTDPSK